MAALRYLFSFKGRVGRAHLWQFLLITALMLVLIAFFDPQYVDTLHRVSMVPLIRGLGWQAELALMLSVIAAYLLLLWAWLALLSKRLHDRGKSGSWILVFSGLPVVCAIATVVIAGVADLGRETPDPGRWPVALTMILALVALAITLWGFVEFYCLRGTRGENRFGPDPLKTD